MLEARGISKKFGREEILRGLNLAVKPGEVVGLIGMNGSGKTTLLDILSGRLCPDRGEVWIDGQRADYSYLRKNYSRVSRAYQVPRLFYGLSVGDNLKLGHWASQTKPHPSFGSLHQLRLENLASTLSIGQRRRVVLDWVRARIGRARYFLLDEPAAGADDALVSELLETLKLIRKADCGALIVEHANDILRNSCDRVVCLYNGAFTDEMGESALLKPAQQGISAPSKDISNSGKGLSIERLGVECGGAQILRDLTIRASRGDIVVVTGPNGCGKSTLLRAVYGDPSCAIVDGQISWEGDQISPWSLADRLAIGIHLMPQVGTLFPSMTVEEALRTCVEAVKREWWARAPVALVRARLPMLERIWHRPCGLLSGGERRIASLARVLLLEPKMALLDEPLAGVDHEGRELILDAVRWLSDQGVLVLVAEQLAFAHFFSPNQVVTLNRTYAGAM
jgi:ABC-type branched-subunit amino acid transport system ATPase component